MAQPEAGQVAELLTRRIGELCRRLLPGGVERGGRWRCGSIEGEPGQSLAVELGGKRQGIWADFGSMDSRHRGDPLDLVACCLFGGDKRRAYHWSLSWLGLDQVDEDGFVTVAPKVESRAPKAKPASDTRGAAMRIFLGARQQIIDTPVDLYLQGRGIELRALAAGPAGGSGGRLPSALRYAPALRHQESDRDWPAMVAAISGADGSIVAVHRTWLEVLAGGRVRKAPVENAKMTLGPYAGGCIRLWRGASGKPWAEAEPGEELVIGEGIEDCLTWVMAARELRTVAEVSGSNRVVLPRAIAAVLLLGQNEANAVARAGWGKKAAHYRGLGLQARVVRPPVIFKDLNEAWVKTRAAAAALS